MSSQLPTGHRVTWVRHGRTASNAARRFLGRTDEPLDDEGRRQIVDLSTRVGPADRVWASPLQRARQTAGALGLPVRVDERLAELDQGELEGLDVRDAIARFPDFFRRWAVDPGSVEVPGGEGLAACQRRAVAVLADVVRGPPGHVVLVSHQLVIASVCCAVDGASLTSWREYRLDNTGIARMHHGVQGWRLSERAR